MTKNRCQICGQSDLFMNVAQEHLCAVCTMRFAQGGSVTEQTIQQIRQQLNLDEGAFLQQNTAQEASRILGKK